MECPLCAAAHEAHESCASAEEGSRVGQVVAGKYRIVRRVARGGMATVYEASHIEIGRPFALKILHAELKDHATVRSRFKHEAKAAGALENDHVAAVLDFGMLPDETLYIVMELLRGEDLATRLAREGTIPPEEAIEIVIQMCAGLQAAHEAKVIHRDLKPGNVFLCRRDGARPHVKLLDFGVARALSSVPSENTEIGATMGTPWYMSPEQARGQRDLDSRSDVYGLGVVLFEMLSGEKPHLAENTNALLHQIATGRAPSLASRCPELSEKLCAVVDRALAPDPPERFASALEFADALRPFTRGAREPRKDEAPALAAASSPVETGAALIPASDPTAPSTPDQEPAASMPAATTPGSGVPATKTTTTLVGDADLRASIPITKTGRGVWITLSAVAFILVVFVVSLFRSSEEPLTEPTAATAPTATPGASFLERLNPAPESNTALPSESVVAPTAEAPLAAAAASSAPANTNAASSAAASSAPASSAPASSVAVSSVAVAASPSAASSPARTAAFPAGSGTRSGSAAVSGSGTISVNAIPRGEVFIDGRSVGMTPTVSLPIAPGTHTVVIAHPERGRLARVVEVLPGESEVVAFRFEEHRVPGAAPPATATAAATPSAPLIDCTPDYWVDRDGIRRLKPECLQRTSNPYR